MWPPCTEPVSLSADRCEVLGVLGFRVLRVKGYGFRVCGLGFRV